MGQVLAIGVAVGSLVLLLVNVLVVRRRPERPVEASATDAAPAEGWPDPESRPQI